MFNRRTVIAAGTMALLLGGLPRSIRSSQAAMVMSLGAAGKALKALEGRHDGRLGLAAMDTGSGRVIEYRAGERFPMCSTHKFLTAAAVLALVDRRALGLDSRVPLRKEDLLGYAPIAEKHVATGYMTVEALCSAAVVWSDNTAGNLLLSLLGGPGGWTRYARSLGDTVSRLDRIEPQLNTSIPGDPRDTTTPYAMMQNVDRVMRGSALSGSSRAHMAQWMFGGKVTDKLLRAGLPDGWRVGDKSGAGENGSRSDIGIIERPGAASMVASIYYTDSAEPLLSRDKLIAEAARIVVSGFVG